ncbi:MAG: Ig-like domain-containing protein [Planctomycetota bacterium]
MIRLFKLPRFFYGLGVLGMAVVLQGCGAGDNETPADNDPEELVLVRIEPAEGESSVARNTRVRLTFNTTVLPESVNDQTVKIRFGPTFGTRPEGSFLVSGNVIEFDPTVLRGGGQNAAGFPAGEQMLVEVPLNVPGGDEPHQSFVQNVEGNPIAVASNDRLDLRVAQNSITFTTGSGWSDPVPGPPGVLGLEWVPAPNAFGQVPSNAAVTVIFSEPVDPGTVLLGVNMFLTNNSPTAPIYQQDIPSNTFFDKSLQKFTFQPVFGFGQGPFNIAVNFIDPDDATSFDPSRLPTDLVGNQIQNFTFLATFDTQFDPTVNNTGLLREDFVFINQRDPLNTTAVWGDDGEFPFELVGLPIQKREQNLNINAFMTLSGGTTVIPNGPPGDTDPQGMGGPFPEGKYCPTVNPLVGGNLTLNPVFPALVLGRRRMNLYRQAELGPAGTVIRAAWGPDSDALFAATYPQVIVKMGHKIAGTSFAQGSFDAQFDVDGFVVLADVDNYKVPQAADVDGNGIKQTGYLDWPEFDRFFDYNGTDDLILDVEATEGTTWQQFRTFIAASGGPPCDCRFLACIANTSIGLRLMDTVFGGDTQNPTNTPGFPNPLGAVDVIQLEIASLLSIGQSLYYDTNEVDPTYLNPIIVPVVQAGGSTVVMRYSASADGLLEDVPFTTNISAADGFRFLRFQAEMRSNIFTSARPRVANIDIPFTFEFSG